MSQCDNYYNIYSMNKYNYLTLSKNNIQENNIQENNIQTGGRDKKIIIHISGPSGAGKTTLGNQLKSHFGKKIIVKDIDDLRQDFIKHNYKNGTIKGNFNKIKYQKYIDDFVSQQNIPLVFVGLNIMPWWHKNHYYNMHATHKYYIDIDADTLFQQKCDRFLDDVFTKHKKLVFEDLKTKEKETIKQLTLGFKIECSYKDITKTKKIWDHDYKSQEYISLPREDIFIEVCKILKRYV